MDLLSGTNADNNLSTEQLAQMYVKYACTSYYSTRGEGRNNLKIHNQAMLKKISDTIDEYYEIEEKKENLLAEDRKVDILFETLNINREVISLLLLLLLLSLLSLLLYI